MAAEKYSLEQEKQLFERLKSDPEVITEIYDRHAQAIYGYLFKRCMHKETAEDIVTQCFIKLMESSSALEWKGVPLSAWLYRVATNALADHWRSAATRKNQPLANGIMRLRRNRDLLLRVCLHHGFQQRNTGSQRIYFIWFRRNCHRD